MVYFEQWLDIILTNRKGGEGILTWQRKAWVCSGNWEQTLHQMYQSLGFASYQFQDLSVKGPF